MVYKQESFNVILNVFSSEYLIHLCLCSRSYRSKHINIRFHLSISLSILPCCLLVLPNKKKEKEEKSQPIFQFNACKTLSRPCTLKINSFHQSKYILQFYHDIHSKRTVNMFLCSAAGFLQSALSYQGGKAE